MNPSAATRAHAPVFGAVPPSDRPRTQAPQFGCSTSCDPFKNADKVFKTYTPKPTKLFQWPVYWLNRHIMLSSWLRIPYWKRTVFRFADADSQRKLKNIDVRSGTLLVSAHPEFLDFNPLAEIHRQAGRYPVAIPFNSEVFSFLANHLPACLQFLLKPIFSLLGLMPVNRGAHNSELKHYTIDNLAHGKWASLFPEGKISLGPRIFPMQKGAVEMAMKAAIQADFKKPIHLLRYAHVWTYQDPERAEKALRNSLAQLERKVVNSETGKSGADKTLTTSYVVKDKSLLNDRVFQIGERILTLQLRDLHITPPPAWSRMTLFEKADFLSPNGIAQMERKYGLPVNSTRLTHNRLMKIRTAIWERLQQKPTGQSKWAVQKDCKSDLQQAQALAYASLYTKKDLTDYGNGRVLDPEMLAYYVRRLRLSMGMKDEVFGRRQVTVGILDPIDVRKEAHHYQALSTQAEKDAYAIALTREWLEKPIQSKINQLRKENIRWQ